MVKKKIFIIGSRGQLGSFLSKNLNLNQKKYKIYLSQNYKFKFVYFKKQINIIEKLAPDLIINCSGYTDVDFAEKNRKVSKLLNHRCVKYLSNYCKKKDVILIHFSTDYVFSGKNQFYEPGHKCNPVNYYGYTKYLGEEEIKKLNFKFYIFRISWLLSSSKLSFLTKIKKKLQSEKKVEVIYDSVSCPTTVIFINKFLKKNIDYFFTKNNKGVYHLVNPVCLSFYRMAKIIEKIIFKRNANIINKVEYKNYNPIAKRPKISKLSIKKTRENFKIPKNLLLNDVKRLLNEKY